MFLFLFFFFLLVLFLFLSVNKRSISICTRLVTHLSCISRPVEKVSCETQRKPEKIEIIMEIKYKTNEHLLSVHLRHPRVGGVAYQLQQLCATLPSFCFFIFIYTHSLSLCFTLFPFLSFQLRAISKLLSHMKNDTQMRSTKISSNCRTTR